MKVSAGTAGEMARRAGNRAAMEWLACRGGATGQPHSVAGAGVPKHPVPLVRPCRSRCLLPPSLRAEALRRKPRRAKVAAGVNK